MRYLKPVLSALVIGLVLIMATDYVAMAATGKPLILGKMNKTKKTTSISSAKGPALKLTTKSGQPPMSVNRNTRVPNLNADLLDGKSAASLGVRTRMYTTGVQLDNAIGFTLTTPFIPPGTYLVTAAGRLNFTGASTAPGTCYTYSVGASQTVTDEFLPRNPRDYYTLSGSGILVQTLSAPVYLVCETNGDPGDWGSTFEDTVTIILTPIDSVTKGTLLGPDIGTD